MQGINCVKGEIHNVLTVLRLNPPRDIPTSSSAAAASSTHSQSASHSHSSSYSHYYSSDPNYDSSLIRQLKDLYELLSLHTSLATIDTVAFLSPFLAVISTDSTDLFTTAAALHSIHKFLVYGLVSHYSAARALILTVHTLTHCRLDAGAYDRQDAEVVQMKVIEVLMECLRSASGDGLNDESVVAMIEHCMLVRRQRDASKVMRRYAENALMQMVLLLFARIGEEGAGGDRARPADVIREPRASRRKHRQSIVVRKEDSITEEDGDDTDSDSVRRLSSASPDGSDYESTSSPSHAPPRLTSTPPPLARALSSSSSTSTSASSSATSSAPYGVSALQRVFVLLIDLINPSSSSSSSSRSSSHHSSSSFSSHQQEADAIFGLRLIRTVLETAGPRLAAYPALVDCIQDKLCKYLLAVSQTRDLFILSLVLRIVFDLFSTVKQHLRVQLEVFFVSIHLRIADSGSTSFQQKELVMESIVEFCKEPSLIVGLYRNYDCEIGATDLYTDLCKFLTTVGTGQATGGRLSSLALEAMVAVLQSIAKRFCSGDSYTSSTSAAAPPTPSASSPSPASYDSDMDDERQPMNADEETALLHSKQHKQKLLLAAQHFNKEGKSSFSYLQSLALLPSPVTADSIVHFFRETPGLNRQRIGEYLGGHEPMQLAVLQRFVETFSFDQIKGRAAAAVGGDGVQAAGSTEVGIDDALRAFLDCFLLPGESQQIGRIMEAFSEAFYRACPGPLLSADAAYVLAYSVIMLNTDAHNQQVSRKMTKEEFVKNLRGINEGKDLPPDYLSQLYDSITSHEIKMTSDSIRDLDGTDGSGFSSRRWQSGLGKQSGLFQTSAPRIHGRDMFNLVWQSAVSMFAAYLENRLLITTQHTDMQSRLSSTTANISLANTVHATDPLLKCTLLCVARELHTLGGSSSAPEHKLLQKVQQGVFAFARICSVYALHDCFNSLVIQLARSLAIFLHDCLHDSTYSPAASFGRDRRAQMVAVTLFKLVEEYGEVGLLEGWTNVLHCLLWLRLIGVLPDSVMEIEDFRDAKGGPLPTLKRDSQPPHRYVQQSSRLSVRPSAAENGDGYSKLSYLVSFFLADDDNPRASASTSAADGQWAAEGKQVIASCKLETLFASSKYFRPASLSCLLRGLLLVSSYATQPSSNISIFSTLTLGEEAAVLCLELLATVVEKNQHRLADPSLKLWQTLYDHLYSAVTHAPPEPTFYIERLVVNILRFAVRLFHGSDPSSASQCIQLLSLMLALSQSTLHVLGSRVVAGLHIFVQTWGDALRDNKSWEVLGRLLLTYRADSDQSVVTAAFGTWQLAIDKFVTVDSFALFLSMLYQWMGQGGADSRKASSRQPQKSASGIPPRQVLDAALRLHAKLASPAIEQELAALAEGTAREKARVDLWLSSVQQLCIACKDHRPDVRRHAMECLQKYVAHRTAPLLTNTALLAHCYPQRHSHPSLYNADVLSPLSVLLASDSVPMRNALAWRICFEKLLLPLLDSVAKLPPTTTASSNSNPFQGPAYDIGVKASSLLFQVFLHHLDTLLLSSDFPLLWLRLLGSIHSHTHHTAGGSGEGRAAVHFIESLKNVLLVMQAAGAWDSVQQRSGQDLWALTMQSIDSFKAEYKQELKECMGERSGGARDAMRGAPQLPPAALSVDSRSVSAASEELNSDVSVASFLRQQPAAAVTLEGPPATAPLTNGLHSLPSRYPVPANGISHSTQPYVAPVITSPSAPSSRPLPSFVPVPAPASTPSVSTPYPVPPSAIQPRPVAAAPLSSVYPVPPSSALQTPVRPAFAAHSTSSNSVPISAPAGAAPPSFHPVPPPVGVVPLRSAMYPPPPAPSASHFRPVPPPAGAALLPHAAAVTVATNNLVPPQAASAVPVPPPAAFTATSAPLPVPVPLPRVSASSSAPLSHSSSTPVVIRFPVRSVLSPTAPHSQQQSTQAASSVPAVPRVYAPPPAAGVRYVNGVASTNIPRVPTVLTSNGVKAMPTRPVGVRAVPAIVE